MEDMNDILNPPKEETPPETPVKEETGEEKVETGEKGAEETGKGEGAESGKEELDPDSPEVLKAKLKEEHAALAKERERVRQKDAALDEALSRVTTATTEERRTPEKEPEKPVDPKAELKELRKQYRDALSATMLDPGDEEAAKQVEELEEKMEEARLAIFNQAATQDKANDDYTAVYKAVHDEFPFLVPDHPQSDADVNNNINTYKKGLEAKGVPSAVALRKAVDLFAPAYAKSIETGTDEQEDSEEVTKKAEADKLIKQKLAKGGFSEVRSVGKGGKGFTGPTPMKTILGKPPG